MQDVTALKTQLSPRIAGSETGAATKSRVAVLPGLLLLSRGSHY